MPNIKELNEGRRTFDARTATRVYGVWDALSDVESYALAIASDEVPSNIGARTRRSFSVTEVAGLEVPHAYEVTVTWTDPSPTQLTGSTGLNYSVQFSVGGETATVLQAVEDATVYGTHDGTFDLDLIGVTDTSIDGTTISAGTMIRSETHTMGEQDLLDLQPLLVQLRNKVNQGVFRGIFLPGEVLFIGAEGQTAGDDSTLTLSFSIGPNRLNTTIAGFSGVNVGAHDYPWIRYGEVLESGTNRQVPQALYVSKVYETASFAGLPS